MKQKILTEYDINKLIVRKKVEKLSAEDNDKYNLSEIPIGDVVISINGAIQTPEDDYTLNGQEINFTDAPQDTDKVVAIYNYSNPTE